MNQTGDDIEKHTFPMGPDSPETDPQSELGEKVINIPLLVDKIIKFSIYKSNGKSVDRKCIAVLRLVNKSWLKATSCLLKKFDDSVITLHLKGSLRPDRDLNGDKCISETENMLENFASMFSDSTRFQDSFLPTCIRLDAYYLSNGDFNRFNNFLERCGDIINKIYVTCLNNRTSIKLTFGNFKLPIVETLNFTFETNTISHDSNSACETNGLKFLDDILKYVTNLKNFTVTNLDSRNIKIQAGSLSLPESIRRLQICSPFTNQELMLLTTSHLPNLEDLYLNVKDSDDGEASTTLEHFQTQLIKVNVQVNYCIVRLYAGLHINFPYMEKLKCLTLKGKDSALLQPNNVTWPILLPNVTCLDFSNITEATFHEWIEGRRFENLIKLRLLLFNGSSTNYKEVESPSAQIMEEIRFIFPYMQKLSIGINLNEMSVLKYLFRYFTHLTKLRLNFYGKLGDSTCSVLASYFLGISLECATAIINRGEDKVEVVADNPETIMNLKGLKSLTLWIKDDYSPKGKYRLFLEFMSNKGLAQMPNLTKIKFIGGFKSLDFKSDHNI